MVGPTLSRCYWGGPGASRRLLLIFGYDSLHPPTPGFQPSSHFFLDIENDNLIAFSFDPGDGLHYGWARLSLNADFFASEVTISEWAYEEEAGKAIHVGSVPAPPAAAMGLTLLGLGAAGLRAHRQRKRAAV